MNHQPMNPEQAIINKIDALVDWQLSDSPAAHTEHDTNTSDIVRFHNADGQELITYLTNHLTQFFDLISNLFGIITGTNLQDSLDALTQMLNELAATIPPGTYHEIDGIPIDPPITVGADGTITFGTSNQ